jgi:hypothetical protein
VFRIVDVKISQKFTVVIDIIVLAETHTVLRHDYGSRVIRCVS